MLSMYTVIKSLLDLAQVHCTEHSSSLSEEERHQRDLQNYIYLLRKLMGLNMSEYSLTQGLKVGFPEAFYSICLQK